MYKDQTDQERLLKGAEKSLLGKGSHFRMKDSLAKIKHQLSLRISYHISI